MVTFILNNEPVSSDKPSGSSLLDFIRYDMDLPGTKIGCREGDCGACTVLEGKLLNGKMLYKSIVSCLTPLGNVQGRHIVTIEGINMEHLSPVQKAIVDNSATQCGFCTPGFVMSFTAFVLSEEKPDSEKAIASVSGNICRCTGYKSIEKAAGYISDLLKDKNLEDPVGWLVEKKFLPDYFLTIPGRIAEMKSHEQNSPGNNIVVAGGTDIMVRNADELADSNIISICDRTDLNGIRIENGKCIIGASVTAGEFVKSSVIKEFIPDITSFFRLISSESIRNMGTVAGNIVNGSPIGDLTIMLLALNSGIILEGSDCERTVPLKDLFLGYKKLDIKKNELVKSVIFSPPEQPVLFNFEKVSKRTHLDIAGVNSAFQVVMEGKMIKECYLSAGGVSPIPLLLKETCRFLVGKTISAEIILEAERIVQSEISPISDVRGSDRYKRLLMRQLFFAHFIKLFPGTLILDDILKIK
jgi:xanthine dehydrogenase small subunit